MKKTLLLLSVLPLLAMGQQGMNFEHSLTWKEIQAKAKAENKYIFVDAFTTWCGPCRQMSANIFPMQTVGDFMNKNFINVGVQLDTTKNDNDEVKGWYADAHDIQNTYKVNVFPTYLFFSPDGKLVHRAIGSSPADEFIAKGADALNPEKQYYTMLAQYEAGKKDPTFLRKAALAAQNVYDKENSAKLGKEYLATQKDLFTKETLDLIAEMTRSSKDDGFALMMNNGQKFDAIEGAGAANKNIVAIVQQEEVFPNMSSAPNTPAPDWTTLTEKVSQKYPKHAKEAVYSSKVIYYQYKQDWPNFQNAVVAYMKEFGASASPAQLNTYAWTVFQNCKDMSCVTQALEWSKKSFKDNENPIFIDTYANILYKMGKKDEAIKWEEKALVLAGNDKTYQATLDKMKKGEKTWKD